MKPENIIFYPDGTITFTLKGVNFKGTEEQANEFLSLNDCQPLELEPMHWSESTGKYIKIKDMNYKHIENYISKEHVKGQWIVYALQSNSNNFRDYIRQLIKHYDLPK